MSVYTIHADFAGAFTLSGANMFQQMQFHFAAIPEPIIAGKYFVTGTWVATFFPVVLYTGEYPTNADRLTMFQGVRAAGTYTDSCDMDAIHLAKWNTYRPSGAALSYVGIDLPVTNILVTDYWVVLVTSDPTPKPGLPRDDPFINSFILRKRKVKMKPYFYGKMDVPVSATFPLRWQVHLDVAVEYLIFHPGMSYFNGIQQNSGLGVRFYHERRGDTGQIYSSPQTNPFASQIANVPNTIPIPPGTFDILLEFFPVGGTTITTAGQIEFSLGGL